MWALALQSTALLVLTFPLRWKEELAADSRLALCPFPPKKARKQTGSTFRGPQLLRPMTRRRLNVYVEVDFLAMQQRTPPSSQSFRLKKELTIKEEPHPYEKVRRRKS